MASSSPPATCDDKTIPLPLPVLAPIPSPKLLLAIPSLVLHPATHKRHHQSVALAQHALRSCLEFPVLDPVDECRAWTGLAELGIGRLESGICGAEDEAEKAITRALLLSNKHPALKLYVPFLTILSARFAQFHQKNTRFAQHALRKLILSLPSEMPQHVVFSIHLALIRSLWANADASITSLEPSLHPSAANSGLAPALAKCLAAIRDLHNVAMSYESSRLVALLALVMKLHLLIRHGIWFKVEEAVTAAEVAFEAYIAFSMKSLRGPSNPSSQEIELQSPYSICASLSSPASLGSQHQLPPQQSPPIPPYLQVHLLVLSALAHTHFGNSSIAWDRLHTLHALVDKGVLGDSDGGLIQISLGDNFPLYVAGTHPRILYVLTCLLSAVAKRDAGGRKPKKKVFSQEGLSAVAQEIGCLPCGQAKTTPPDASTPNGINWSIIGGKEVILPVDATVADVANVKKRMVLMRADLLAEIVSASIMRSEFDEADGTLNELIAHLRTHHLFPAYAARVTMLHAQFAHAQGRPERAKKCYQVAAWLASGAANTSRKRTNEGEEEQYEKDEWVRIAARAGEVWVRLGMVRERVAKKRRAVMGEEISVSLWMSQSQDVNVEGGDRDRDLDVQMCMSDHVGEKSDLDEGNNDEDERELHELRQMSKEVVEDCLAMGGTLGVVGEIIRGCFCDEVLAAKTHLRNALALASRNGDNHLRAIILALSASYYLLTAKKDAETMLGTCENIAAGLGADEKEKDRTPRREANCRVGMGNLKLRVWVGQQLLDLHRSARDMTKADKQKKINRALQEALEQVKADELAQEC